MLTLSNITIEKNDDGMTLVLEAESDIFEMRLKLEPDMLDRLREQVSAQNKKYLVVSVEPDEDMLNPADPDNDDGAWTVHSFSRKHCNYKNPADFDPEEDTFLRNKLAVGLAFYLDYYEHGACRWSLHGEGMQCQWDTSNMAGIIIWDHEPSDMGAKTIEERAADARALLETYNDWCNGYGLGYRISLSDDPDDDGEQLDSCWGWYASCADDFKVEVGAAVKCLKAKYPDAEVVIKGDDILAGGLVLEAVAHDN